MMVNNKNNCSNMNNKKLILFKAKVKDTEQNIALGYQPNSWIVGSLFGIDFYNGSSVTYIIPIGEDFTTFANTKCIEIISETLCEYTGWIVSQEIYSGPDEGMNRIPLVDQLFDVAKNNNIDILPKIHINENTGIVTAKIIESELVDFLRKDRFDKVNYINTITLEFIFTNDILKSDYGIAEVKYGHFADTDHIDEMNDYFEGKGYYIKYMSLDDDNQNGEIGAESIPYPFSFDYFTIIDNIHNEEV